MVILAHHEIFILVIQWILALSAGGFICFKFLFPMIGRGIVDLNLKLQRRIAKLKANEDKWKQGVREKFEKDVQRRKDDRFYLDESEIKSAYEENGFPTSIKQKPE